MKKTNNKSKNNTTELVFILDRSGSMAGLERDTIGGFNSMLEKQKKESSRAYVSTILFDHESEVIYDRVDINRVSPMTDETYYVRGCTALLDALGGAIHHIANIHKYARKEDVPANTLFVIITDGMENASKHYSANKVKQMVKKEQEKYGWEFLFIGANIDAVETAENYGIRSDRAVDYCCDSQGTAVCYETVCQTVSNMRNNMPISSDWSENIKKDFNDRK
ncbi:MAG: hypothetical protein ACI4V4_04805 [Eubacterium sp.]